MPKKALVVDDIAYARKAIKEILQQNKYTVVGEASNGNEAINMYLQLKPDFVIMDIVMPSKSGIEAARKILENDKDARIVLISSIVNEQVMMDSINSGARDFIVKPFDAADLIMAIEKALQGKEAASSHKTVSMG